MKKPLLLLLSICILPLLLASCSILSVKGFVEENTITAPAPSDANNGPTSAYVLPGASDGQFNTPEAAIKYFMDCLKRNDFTGATTAFAIQEIPDHLDYDAWADRLKIVYTSQSFLPRQYRDLNRAMLVGQAAACYRSALLGVFGMDWQSVQVKADDSGTAAFIEGINPDKLAGLNYGAIEESALMDGDLQKKYTQNMAAQAKVYGADECRAYRVLAGLKGSFNVCCEPMLVLNYGGNWKIASGLFELPGGE